MVYQNTNNMSGCDQLAAEQIAYLTVELAHAKQCIKHLESIRQNSFDIALNLAIRLQKYESGQFKVKIGGGDVVVSSPDDALLLNAYAQKLQRLTDAGDDLYHFIYEELPGESDSCFMKKWADETK